MALINIPTSGLWSTIATALNDNFSELDSRTGWGEYADTQYTSGNPFVISVGTTVSMPNNAANKIETQLPLDVPGGLYNGSRLLASLDGNFYNMRVEFTMFSSVNDGAFDVALDISSAGDGSEVIETVAIRSVRGSGSGNAEQYTVNMLYETNSTFVANGGLLRFGSIAGNTSIYDISYLISRTHKAR